MWGHPGVSSEVPGTSKFRGSLPSVQVPGNSSSKVPKFPELQVPNFFVLKIQVKTISEIKSHS